MLQEPKGLDKCVNACCKKMLADAEFVKCTKACCKKYQIKDEEDCNFLCNLD